MRKDKIEIVKLFSLTFLLALSCYTAISQVPQAIKLQALARDSNGQVLKQEDVSLRVSIVNTLSETVYREQHSLTTSPYGVMEVSIGDGVNSIGVFKNISWESGGYYVKLEIDETGGTDYNELGTSKLLAVPYALHAAIADSLNSVYDERDPLFLASEASKISEEDIFNLGNLSGINTGDQDLSGLATKDELTQNVFDLLTQIREDSLQNSRYIEDLKDQVHEMQDLLFELQFKSGKDSVPDSEGNYYKIVQIGEQIWMAENLRSTKYADGTPIPTVDMKLTQTERNNLWAALGNNRTGKAYCWYDDDSTNAEPYGALYTHAAALNGDSLVTGNVVQGVCPNGWHIPSYEDYIELGNFLYRNGHNYDGSMDPGYGKLAKSIAATYGWDYYIGTGNIGKNIAANNSSGFSGVGGGYRRGDTGEFSSKNKSSLIWSSSNEPYMIFAFFYSEKGLFIGMANIEKSFGHCVRCLKD